MDDQWLKNKRKAIRRKTDLFFHLNQMVDPVRGQLSAGGEKFLIRDLSSTGMRIETKAKVPNGATLRGRFQIPGEGKPIELELVVLRIDAPGVLLKGFHSLAIKIVRISDADRLRIERYVTTTSVLA